MKRKQYNWQLPPEIKRRLGETTYGRQRAIYEADHLLIILHVPPEGTTPDRENIVFLRTPDGKYYCNGKEGGEIRLRRLLESYDNAFEKYDRMYRRSDCSVELFDVMKGVVPLSRAAANLHAALQSARSYIKGDTFLIAMRDEAYEVSRNFELLLGDAKINLDHQIAENAEYQAARSEEMATAQHRLNVLAAVTFPLMAIAALLGMNLPHGLEGLPSYVFWVVVGACVVIGLGVMGWVTRNGDREDH